MEVCGDNLIVNVIEILQLSSNVLIETAVRHIWRISKVLSLNICWHGLWR